MKSQPNIARPHRGDPITLFLAGPLLVGGDRSAPALVAPDVHDGVGLRPPDNARARHTASGTGDRFCRWSFGHLMVL